ncbi:type II toxin-antitoxin system HicA family toxin [Agrococcus sp. KRD186]|uniref:type II toxin-antitoxin system HicA family toxin n=1 Tax=Agrococcus sp. KRD186 TaxID=2729730 RepID=UPI0019CF6210|nr:type II toxin-antitoxin system HicA family toxin [Agrococcus sp. KRD186]
MKPQKTKDVTKHLKSLGWVFLRDAKGSHEVWGLPDESVKHLLPTGHKEISAGVLNQLKDKGVPIPKQRQ